MANEYLKRTPTSSGNRQVFTWSGWVKKQQFAYEMLSFSGPNTVSDGLVMFGWGTGTGLYLNFYSGSTSRVYEVDEEYRDFGSWLHYQISVDTTQTTEDDRINFYINGVQRSLSVVSGYSALPQNYLLDNMTAGKETLLGTGRNSSGNFGGYSKLELSDIFFVDGQALTPDVFGFYKDGDGYQSSGTTQATDFRPGQWSPRLPKSIKYTINRSGGFGVNGFYLPMNDSSNPGADFHCAPNSIIKLKGEDLPQPRNGAPTTSDAYVSELRSDPFAANLVLAIPGIIGGQGSGYGDYSADIKGSGSNKTVTSPSASAVFSFSSYYGSALVFDVFDGNYLSIPNSSDFNFSSGGDFTVELWYYRQVDNTTESLIGVFENSSARRAWQLESRANAGLRFQWWTTGSGAGGTIDAPTSAVPKDQWHHICAERNGDSVTLYINGVASAVDTSAASFYNNTTDPLRIGMLNAAEDQMLTGRLQDVRIYKGLAKYKGGFDVPKPYTPVGIEAFRTIADTCKNNFATLNPLRHGGSTNNSLSLTNGNLRSTHNNSGQWQFTQGTMAVSSGKWYYECKVVTRPTAVNENYLIGFYNTAAFNGGYYTLPGNLTAGVRNNIFKVFNDTSETVYGTKPSNGDVLMFALDVENSKFWVGLNGVWMESGNPELGINASISENSISTNEWVPHVCHYAYSTPYGVFDCNFGQNPSFSGDTTAGTNADSNGKGLFKYAPPTGFLALCEDNLPTPAIADPGDYMRTVLYTGDGNGGRSITGVGFKPDFVWIKSRNASLYHLLTDSVRGVNNTLSSNTTDNEAFSTEKVLNSFDNDGFSLNVDDGSGYFGWNVDGQNMVAWCWKAGGAAVANTDGSITSQVSANQTAGFSIVSWTSDGTNLTVGHGLNKVPSLIIQKQRDASANWTVYHEDLAATEILELNTTTAKQTSSDFGNTRPTSSVLSSFTTGVSGRKIIAYCWAEIEGYSKFGSYIGNASTDGPFVYCGFKPAWVMIKAAVGTTNGWAIMDNARSSNNPNGESLFAHNSNIEVTDLNLREMDFVSNGFKIRAGIGTERNADGATYVFMAFAESPFQTANAK